MIGDAVLIPIIIAGMVVLMTLGILVGLYFIYVMATGGENFPGGVR